MLAHKWGNFRCSTVWHWVSLLLEWLWSKFCVKAVIFEWFNQNFDFVYLKKLPSLHKCLTSFDLMLPKDDYSNSFYTFEYIRDNLKKQELWDFSRYISFVIRFFVKNIFDLDILFYFIFIIEIGLSDKLIFYFFLSSIWTLCWREMHYY